MPRWIVCAFCVLAAHAADLSGRVTDENDAPVPRSRITVRAPQASGGGPWRVESDPAGFFSIALPASGDYLVDVEREGYYRLSAKPVHVEGALQLALVVNTVREVFQSVNVAEQPSPVDVAENRNEERLTGTEVNDIPYPNSHSLRSAMQLMPGVLQDPAGSLHFNGSSEGQVQYLLNGFNVSDPVTNQFLTILAVEGVQSMSYQSGRYPADVGRGTAGVLAIRTENGTDAFRYTATDFIPGVNVQQGVRLGNWYPRVGLSGPIARGRAWFSDTLDFEYNNAYIAGLPAGQNTRSGWLAGNLLHTQFNLSPRNILYADFLVNAGNAGRVGLSPLDPVSTTRTVRRREYLGGVRDQMTIGGGALVEIGYAHNAFSNNQTPQGQNLYTFSPAGRAGNYFVSGSQTSSRDQWLAHGYAPQFRFAGTHQIEAGGDLDLLRYDGNFHRTGYQLIGLSGQVLSTTTFTGSGIFAVHDIEAAAWVQDTWRIAKRMQIDAGIREDWDQLVASIGWSPRVAVSWSPFEAGHTRLAGGYAITYDAVPLDPFGRVLDQFAVTTTPAAPPAMTTFTRPASGLKLPRASNWSASVDHEVSAHLSGSVKYLRRRGTDGFDFVNVLSPDAPLSLLPLPNGAAPGEFQLTSLRRDDFDSAEFTIRQTFSGQYEWMASYTRSRAQSNALLDLNTITPIGILPVFAPMPWDAPNRVLGRAYLPLPLKNWSLAVLADARSGFPFSIEQQTGVVSGAVNSYRYPFNFDLNIAIERMVTLHGYRFALRGGANNLTNTRNPTAVNNVIGSPQYLQFLGFEGRHFVVRIRFFGRAATK